MKRRTPISISELSRQQRFTAATMKNVARRQCAGAANMYDAAERMLKTAHAAIVETRRQLRIDDIEGPPHAR